MSRWIALFALLGACVEPATMSFEEFRASTYREPDTGIYIVDGDEPILDDIALRHYYDRHIARGDDGLGTAEQGLAVNTLHGVDDVWTRSQARNLTFCVSSSFGARHQTVLDALTAAAAAWEAVADVNFVYSPAHDLACTSSNVNVVFNVRPIVGSPALARAFFPSTPRGQRELAIDTQAFGNLAPLTLAGVLRHELGHALGFRHEHLRRRDFGGCVDESGTWRGVTSYDSASVMHYAHCAGTNDGDYVLTDLDKQGAFALYPPPFVVQQL